MRPQAWGLNESDAAIHRQGFTLIEVLLALAIVAVIALLGYRALSALSESETRLTVEAARWRTLDLFSRGWRATCVQPCRGRRVSAKRAPALGRHRPTHSATALRVLARRTGIHAGARKRRATASPTASTTGRSKCSTGRATTVRASAAGGLSAGLRRRAVQTFVPREQRHVGRSVAAHAKPTCRAR